MSIIWYNLQKPKTNKRIMRQAICKLLDISDKTFYNWKKEGRLIIKLLEKYFSENEIENFIENGVITRLEPQIDIYIASANKLIDVWNMLKTYDYRIEAWQLTLDKGLTNQSTFVQNFYKNLAINCAKNKVSEYHIDSIFNRDTQILNTISQLDIDFINLCKNSRFKFLNIVLPDRKETFEIAYSFLSKKHKLDKKRFLNRQEAVLYIWGKSD